MAQVYDYDEVTQVAQQAFDAGVRISTALAAKYNTNESNARVLASKLRRKGYPIPVERGVTNTLGLPANVYEHLAKPEPWMQYGECATMDPDLFFPKRGGTIDEARAACAVCSCRKACLEYALRAGEKYGVWGGLSERERRRLRRQIRVQTHTGNVA